MESFNDWCRIYEYNPKSEVAKKNYQKYRSDMEELKRSNPDVYYDAHRCYDPTGKGCCEQCGGVIRGSQLDKELHGYEEPDDLY